VKCPGARPIAYDIASERNYGTTREKSPGACRFAHAVHSDTRWIAPLEYRVPLAPVAVPAA